MRPRTKLAVVAAVVVVAFVAILAGVPLAFRGRIGDALNTQINSSVDARVAWRDLDLSLLRGFPNVSLTVSDLSVSGVRSFQGDTLFTTRRFRLLFDLGSVIGYLRHGAPIVVREVAIEEPTVQLLRRADGTANWNITRPQPQTSAPPPQRPVRVSLRRLRIERSAIHLDDRQANLAVTVIGFDESLSGDFSQDRVVFETRTHADSLSATFAGIPYLRRASLDLTANVDADMRAQRFALRNDTLRLNKLVLALSATAIRKSPNVAMDMTFAAPSTAFAEILSLVPAIYARDFAKLQTSGTMAFSGRVHGVYGPASFPAFSVRARVDNGAFRYSDLPLGAKQIALDLAADNPGGNVDSTTIDVKRFHAVLGSRPVDMRLLVRTPVRDPDVTLQLTGSVDLAEVARTVKLEGVSTLSGVVSADLATHTRVSDVNAQRYDRVAADGRVSMSRVAVRSSSLPHPIAVDTLALALTPRNAALTAFAARAGASDVRASGTLENLIGFLLHDDDLRGRATVSSEHVDLNEWRSNDKTTQAIPVPPRVDFTLDAAAARVVYGPLTLADVKGTLLVKDQRVTMRDLTMHMLGGSVVANGYYETLNMTKPAFGMNVGMTTLDIPAAVTSVATVQRLVPIAKYAQGRVSGTLAVTGPLSADMSPVLTALTGKGDVTTDGLVLRGAPVMQKLASALSLRQLESPAFGIVHALFDFADGRVHTKPFTMSAEGVDVTASGSNGVDQSLSYDLALAVPRALSGPATTAAISRLGRFGAQLPPGNVVQLRAKVAGTVTNPTVTADFAGMAASMQEATRSAAQQIATGTADAARQRADSAAQAATARARAEADRMIAEAERQADSIRAAARTVADNVRRDADARIDSLMARASNPIARVAARKAADQLRSQADRQAERVVQAANARADSLVAQAKQKAAAP